MILLQGQDLNLRPPAYEAGELPGCSTRGAAFRSTRYSAMKRCCLSVRAMCGPLGFHAGRGTMTAKATVNWEEMRWRAPRRHPSIRRNDRLVVIRPAGPLASHPFSFRGFI